MIVLYFLAAVFLFIIPGWACVSVFFKERFQSFFEKIGVSAGISIALYPLLLLWFFFIRLPIGFWISFFPGFTGILVLLWNHRRKLRLSSGLTERSSPPNTRPKILYSAILIVVAVIFFSRFFAIRGMSAPAWGDSVHHTLIVQLLLDNGGLFDSWQPYAPLESLTYHFGFHASAASWAWLTGVPAARAVLVVGQIFNGLAVLALFSLVCRLSGSRWAGLASLIIIGLVFPLPGFYVNWGRYTQLTGQIILPVLILLFDLQWSKKAKPQAGTLVIITVLFSGLILCHYRVALLAAVAALSWCVWGLWQMRHKLSAWVGQALGLGGAAAATCLLILPWLMKIRQSRVHDLFTKENAFRGGKDFWIWKNTSFYFSDWFLILGVIVLFLAFIFGRRFVLPLAGWCLVSFFLTNPFLLGLPAFAWTNNALLLFAIYIPLGVLLGWITGVLIERAQKKQRGAFIAGFLLLLFTIWGAARQIRIVDPFFQMVTPSDEAVFNWIKDGIPNDAVFLVNGFLPSKSSLVAGSDAGWWLPYHTGRTSVLPPALYRAETLDPSVNVDSPNLIVQDILASSGDAEKLSSVLCLHGITHVFLGQKRGTVGYGAQELIPEEWLSKNPDFTLLFQEGKAQVWRFTCRD